MEILTRERFDGLGSAQLDMWQVKKDCIGHCEAAEGSPLIHHVRQKLHYH